MIIATIIMSIKQTSLKVENRLALSKLFILIQFVHVGQFIVSSTYIAFSMKNNEMAPMLVFQTNPLEWNSFIMKTLYSVLINLHRYRPRVGKRSKERFHMTSHVKPFFCSHKFA